MGVRHDTGGQSVSLLRRMARFDDLPADQKAVLQLVLRQGRTYEEIAALLKISPDAVRDRALTALDALGPRDLAGLDEDRQDEVGDYLLGQQGASARAASRSPSPPATGRARSPPTCAAPASPARTRCPRSRPTRPRSTRPSTPCTRVAPHVPTRSGPRASAACC
jgi:hypothetical protein